MTWCVMHSKKKSRVIPLSKLFHNALQITFPLLISCHGPCLTIQEKWWTSGLLQLPWTWRRMLNNTNHTRRALVLDYNTVKLLINTSDVYVWPSSRSVPQCLVALASSRTCVHDILIHNLARKMGSVTNSRSHERLPKNSKNLNTFRFVHGEKR